MGSGRHVSKGKYKYGAIPDSIPDSIPDGSPVRTEHSHHRHVHEFFKIKMLMALMIACACALSFFGGYLTARPSASADTGSGLGCGGELRSFVVDVVLMS